MVVAIGLSMRIMKGALVEMKVLKQNSLYLLQGSTITGAAASSSSCDIDYNTTKLWHMHFGHMSERIMDVLSKQGLLGSKKTRNLDFCEHCVFAKQYRVKFSRAVHTTKGKLVPKENMCIFLGCSSEKEVLIDAGKDQGVSEKIELEIEGTLIRVLLAMIALYDLELDKLDVKTTFLNCEFERAGIHALARGVYDPGQGRSCLLVEEILVWIKAIFKGVV
ncbi:hypothetical protein RJ639_020165 [Escallonia herrerae]|uniref:GAG-pre-integrase domain-containing protein n=1 Tax=Escallonia herrerae TaxID=1293975 RepID=A0AA88V816_9ASTE|nr:hypothetical protein RJ639_020165 [Escallonia herrerae]